MDGRTYNLYNNKNLKYCVMKCFYYYWQASWTTQCCCLCSTSSWRNWKCENASSYLDYAKTNDINKNVYFPSLIQGDVGTACRTFCISAEYNFCAYSCCSWGCSGTIEYDIPEATIYSLATMCQFPAWKCVGKNVFWYLWALICDKTFDNSSTSCYCGSSYRTWKVCWYVHYWLLHTDGTKDDLYCCLIVWWEWKRISACCSWIDSYWSCCWILISSNKYPSCRYCFEMTNPNVNILHGDCKLDWLTTQEWDRLFFEVWIKAVSWTINIYNSNYCGYSSYMPYHLQYIDELFEFMVGVISELVHMILWIYDQISWVLIALLIFKWIVVECIDWIQQLIQIVV